MRPARPAVLLLGPVLLSFWSLAAAAQEVGVAAIGKQPVLSLTFGNNGQDLVARVGQQIEISLGSIGPRQYGAPEISSPAIRLLSTALDWPPNPGGPGFVRRYVESEPRQYGA